MAKKEEQKPKEPTVAEEQVVEDKAPAAPPEKEPAPEQAQPTATEPQPAAPTTAEMAAVMSNMQQEIDRLRNMVGEVGDRSRIDRFLKKEQAERERAGHIDRTCFVQMFNNKFVLSWASMRPTDNRVYVNEKGRLIEEINIPSISLIDPADGKTSTVENVSYRMFHQTRVHTPARVVEILNETDTQGLPVRKYRLEVEGYDIPLIIDERFVN